MTSQSADEDLVWEKHFSTDGHAYFYNTVTEEVQWEDQDYDPEDVQYSHATDVGLSEDQETGEYQNESKNITVVDHRHQDQHVVVHRLLAL